MDRCVDTDLLLVLAMLFMKEELLAQLNKYTINDEDRNFVYGTAGFRTAAVRLFGIAFRIGMMTVLRSMQEVWDWWIIVGILLLISSFVRMGPLSVSW